MLPDDELCLCFHVTQRKVVNFLRVERPRVASQMSECFGAGTGCGWCRPFLLKLWEAHQAAQGKQTQSNQTLGKNPAAISNPPAALPDAAAVLPDAAEYARERAAYVKSGGGTPPPGATPVE
jgi:bacterioferritin-associated ferredoxin